MYINKQKVYKNNYIEIYMCLNSDWTLQACWSPMGLHRHVGFQWGMSVSDGSPKSHVGVRRGRSVSNGSPIRHVGLRWACRSPMKRVEVFDWSLISHVGLR